jgi:hypothetical protein
VPAASSYAHPFAVAPIIVVDSLLNFRYLRHAGALFRYYAAATTTAAG